MSPTMALTMPQTMYTPTSDVMERHEYGISKHHRKTSSTGGGRAWSEDEEVYLLQTRLQKMPYKHIAAHLKKTELACRLHYHQLSHGSNRRKRTTSMSSTSSSTGHSPLINASIPSPIHETPSRSVSPPGSLAGYMTSNPAVQLPSIMNAAAHHHHHHHSAATHSSSPRLPAILPKPANMSLALSGARYGAALQDHSTAQHSAPLLPSASFSAASQSVSSSPMSSLRLDCSTSAPQVDMGRLHAVYNAHRQSFWSAVAADYGNGVHPTMLEQAWRTGNATAATAASTATSTTVPSNASSGGYNAAPTPITPVGSPDERDLYNGGSSSTKQDKTRISAILGIDANPRSPKERELVKRMEQERVMMVGVGA